MASKRKNKARTIVLVIVVALLLIIGWALHRKTPASAPVSSGVAPASSSSVDWSKMLPKIKTALGKSFSPSDVGSRAAISIAETGDVTGDGVPEAFVDMGYGGASTDELSLVGLKNSVVTVLQAEGPDMPLGPVDFSQGSAALSAVGVGMDAADNAIYSTELDYNSDGSLDTCTLSAYTWDAADQAFEFSQAVSQTLQKAFCASVKSGAAQTE